LILGLIFNNKFKKTKSFGTLDIRFKNNKPKIFRYALT